MTGGTSQERRLPLASKSSLMDRGEKDDVGCEIMNLLGEKSDRARRKGDSLDIVGRGGEGRTVAECLEKKDSFRAWKGKRKDLEQRVFEAVRRGKKGGSSVVK